MKSFNLKRLRASHNIRFPEENSDNKNPENNLSMISKEVAQLCLNYFKSNSNNINNIGEVMVTSPYTNIENEVTIRINPNKDKGVTSSIIPFTDPMILDLYPYRIKKQGKTDSQLLDSFYESVVHELTHTIDPKIPISKQFDPRRKRPRLKTTTIKDGDYKYITSPQEIDAFSKQIAEHIKLSYDPQITPQILLDWLKLSNIFPLPDILIPFNNYFEHWELKPTVIKTIKQRIYDDLEEGYYEK